MLKSSELWLGLSWVCYTGAKTQYGGTADPGRGQPGKALAQMVAELAATQKEQAAEARHQWGELWDRTDHTAHQPQVEVRPVCGPVRGPLTKPPGSLGSWARLLRHCGLQTSIIVTAVQVANPQNQHIPTTGPWAGDADGLV